MSVEKCAMHTGGFPADLSLKVVLKVILVIKLRLFTLELRSQCLPKMWSWMLGRSCCDI